MKKQKRGIGQGSPTLGSILAKYRPINADSEDIARIKRLYSGLTPEIYSAYDLAWESLMRHLSLKDNAKKRTISNLGFLCLLDLERTMFLQQIIERTMSMASTPGQLNVIDLGAGTGILGLTALELGAGSLTLVEYDRESLAFLDELLCAWGFTRVSKSGLWQVFSKEGKTVSVYSGDAKEFRPLKRPERYDLVLCELHETHLISEDEVAALRNIRKYARPDAVFIPSADDLMLSVCDSGGNDLSDAVMIGSVDFGRIRGEGISFGGKLTIKRGGQAKYLKLWDRLYFPDNTVCEREFRLFTQTKYMLLKGWEPKLKRGQSLFLSVRFRFGDSSYNGYSLELR